MKRIVFLLAGLTVSSALVGCGRQGPVAVHPVSGRILYGGKAAEGVTVYFLPTSAPTVPVIPGNPHAVTGPDGRFSLTTYAEGDGAAEGGYQVVLLWPNRKAGEDEDSDSDRLLGWYDAVRSPLSAEVKPGTNVLEPFNLPVVTRAPEASQGVPGRN